MTNTEHQKGVALLFALGILSLILVMGLAFLGNSLISQKIAFNSQESSVSRFLARSAVDRALAHLTLFNLIQARDHATFYAADASSVFSRISAGNLNVAGDTQTTGSVLAAVSQDQLSGNDSKLNVEKKYDTPWYWGKNSAAKWIYVHQNGVESAGDTTTNTSNPIVARYAYQVLPQTSLSRISLYGVTSGANGIAGTTPAATNPRIPHFHRWGADVDELIIPGLNNMFLTYWGDENSQRVDGQYEFDNFINLLSSSNTPNPFYGSSKDVENRKRWLRNIFVEGKGRVAREAYSDGYNWYPRFNLGKHSSGTDPWYSRFLRSGENDSNLAALRNSAHVLDRLTAPAANSADCKFDDSKVRDNDYLTATTPNPIGLPFLRSIGDRGTGAVDAEIGAFPSVESLRKQIAANLNDYCDDDSIPTSDKPADTWITDDEPTSTPPKYTGNEATPYINEIGFGFQIKNPKFNQGEKYTFSAEAQSEAWVELIKVYRNMIPDSIASYGFAGKITDLELVLKVTIGGKATFFEKVNEGGQEVEKVFLKDQEFDDVSAESTGGGFASNTAPFELSIKKGEFSGGGPYWLKNIQFNKTVSLNADFTDGIKEKVAHGSVFDGKVISKIEVELSKIKIEISKVKFNLGNLVLYDDSGSSKIGVDFVTVEKEGSPREVAPGITLCDGDKDKFNEAFAPNNAIIAFAGGMEAIDPRQNLNARSVQDKMNDWRNVDKPSFAYVPVKGETQHHFPVDDWKWDLHPTSTRVTGGSVNDSSKPNAPMYAD
ncbi:MAG: hypothetical protein IJV93_00555, partial [Lentisphaeria bacterium]|nr:hypothetical protein [Lentisphaeria bacterium]